MEQYAHGDTDSTGQGGTNARYYTPNGNVTLRN